MKILACTIISLFSISAWATGPSLTYHGRILKADGTPVLATAVLFKIQFRSPGTENCLMYEESLTQNLGTTNGAFAISLNSGAGTRTDISGYSLEKIFSNRVPFSFPTATCAVGTTYSPASTDGRSLLVYFNDGTFSGWEPVPQQSLNLVPQAIEALQVGGFSASSLLRVENGAGPQAVAAFTPANITELLAIIGGTSTKYMQTAGGTQSPVLTTPPTTPVAGQIWFDPTDSTFKYFDGTTTTPVGGGGGGGGPVTGTVDVAHGGTGVTTLSDKRLMMGNGTAAVSSVASGTTGQILRSAGAAAAPAWTTTTFPDTVTNKALLFGSSANIVGEVTVPSNPNVLLSTAVTGAPQWSGGSANTFLKGSASGVSFSAVDLATADVTGTLTVAKGGTGGATLTDDRILMGNGASGIATLAAGTSGQMLRSAGSAASPSWTTTTYPDTVTNKAILFGSATNVVGEVTVPSNPSVLLSTAVTGAPQWTGGSANTFLKGSASGVSFAAIDLATADVTGTLTVAKGGTGVTSLPGTFVMVDGQDGALTLGTNNANSLTLETNNVAAMTIDSAGRVGVGVASPSAFMQLKAGSATAGTAPLKFTSGPLLSAAEAGALEFDGTSLYFTNNAGTRSTVLSGGGGSFTGVSSVANSGGNITLAAAAGTGSVLVNSGVASTSTSTGAMVVTGGVGASGNIYSGGSINAASYLSAVTATYTPQVYGSSAVSGTLTLDGTSDATKGYILMNVAGGNVGIGTATPTTKLEVSGTIKATAFVGPLTSTTVSSGAGTTAAPGISFAGESGTGISNPATNTLSLSAGGAEGLRVNTAASAVNYLSITPSATTASPMLAASGTDTDIDLTLASKGSGIIVLAGSKVSIPTSSSCIALGYTYSAATGCYGNTLSLGGYSTSSSIGMARNNTASQDGKTLSITAGSPKQNASNKNGGDLSISSGQSTGTGTSNINFLTATAGGTATADNAPTAKMTILGSGNVGIGTTTPGSTLEVAGTATIVSSQANVPFNISRITSSSNSAEMTYRPVTTAAASPTWITGLRPSSNDFALTSYDGTTYSTRLSVNSSGYVGVGSATPTNPLTLPAGSATTPSLSFGDSGTGFYRQSLNVISFAGAGTRWWDINSYLAASNAHGPALYANTSVTTTTPIILPDKSVIDTGFAAGTAGNINAIVGGVEVMRWASGNVGIGTSSPTGLLHLAGAKNMTPASNVGSHFTESGVQQNDNGTAASGTATTATFHYFGTPTLTASNTVVTTTNANGITIASAPWAGTNQTITNTTALNINGGAVNSVGTVANSYGLKVAANSGATKNYAATFSGGNVGVGTTAPTATLDVNGQVKGGFVSHSSLNTDWATGNIQSTSVAAGTLTFTAGSMFDGANYTLIITSAGSYVLGTNADITAWRCLPACPSATITASGHTVMTIIKAGTTGYVSWLAGF